MPKICLRLLIKFIIILYKILIIKKIMEGIMKKIFKNIFSISLFFIFSTYISCSGPSIVVEEDVSDLKQAVKDDPNNYVLLYNLGLKYLSDNKYDKALEVFNKCLLLRPQFSPVHFAIYCAEYAKDPELYRESLREEPSDHMIEKINTVNSHLNFAFVYNPFFDWKFGTVLLESRPATMNPLYNEIYDLLFDGFEQFFLGEYDVCITRLNKTISAFPNYTQARLVRGLAHSQLKNYQVAIDDFQNIIDDIEDYNKSMILPVYLNPAYLYYLIGYAYLQKGDLKDAKDSFKKVIINDLGFYMAHYQLSNVYHKQQNLDKAIQELDAALIIEPKDALIHFNKGVFLMQTGNILDAISSYNNVISINPNYFEAYFNLALIYEAIGDKSSATEYYKNFINACPKENDDYIKKAEEKIKLLKQ